MNPAPFSPSPLTQTFVPGFKLQSEVPSRPRAFVTPLAWINGQIVPFDPAHTRFLNPSGQEETPTWAGIRSYATPRGPAVFRLHEQMALFRQMVQVSGYGEPRFTLEQLCQAVFAVIEGNGLSDCWVRPRLFFNADNGEPIITLMASACELLPEAEVMVTMRTALLHNPRLWHSPTQAKGTIFLDQDGFVTSESHPPLFLVREGCLYTAPSGQEDAAVMRDTVLTLARDAGYTVAEKPLTREDLFRADELFLCDPALEIVAVGRVDDRLFGSGQRGRVTQIIQKMLAETVRGRSRRSLHWLEYVVSQPVF